MPLSLVLSQSTCVESFSHSLSHALFENWKAAMGRPQSLLFWLNTHNSEPVFVGEILQSPDNLWGLLWTLKKLIV